MSFRENLQHLRSTRNMTQEQLAMLLGVSRQTVTKWESGRSNPEMDKLLQMCSLFECTLDDLVTGDLTGRPTMPKMSVPQGPASDVCGYDEHMRSFALRISSGVAIIVAGIGLSLPFENSSILPGSEPGTSLVVIALITIACGLALIIPAGMAHSDFSRKHPYVEDFYDDAQKSSSRTALARAIVAGIAIVFAGLIALIASEGSAFETQAISLFMVLAAAASWLFVYFGIMLSRTNLDQRNANIANELEYEEIARAQIDEEVKSELLKKHRANAKTSAVCGSIMIVATIVGLALLFAPVLSCPDPSSFEPEGTSAMWFWAAWPAGGMLCGIVALLMEAFRKRD